MVADELTRALIEETTLEDISESYRPVVDIIGIEKFIELSEYAKGDELYFPKTENIIAPARNRRIKKEWNGYNSKELAEKYNLSVMEMTGFLDGINDSLVEANPIDTMEEDTKVNLVFDKEKLYKNMVDAKADWLYELPQWKEIFDDEKRRALFLEQKKSGTVHVGKKVGRNDPCPCGSGKKYKYCCGR